MAGASLLTLLDDIATVLDDVAVMTKVAAKKTAGVLGDDLALNAQQVSGVRAERELPVVWAVAKGSMLNKFILVPAALAISVFIPWLITPLLMIGGAYLCFEGFEKIAHEYLHKKENAAAAQAVIAASKDTAIDMKVFEQEKIKGAIRTDFVLSAEIIVIALGTVGAASFIHQAAVVSSIAIIMTVGVYSFVAGIVKLDDAGFYLLKKTSTNLYGRAQRSLGRGLVAAAPRLMKVLAFVGTIAMFLVGGGILQHGLPFMHDTVHHLIEVLAALPLIGAALAWLAPSVIAGFIGVLAGGLVLLMVTMIASLKGLFTR